MTISMYQLSADTYIRSIANLITILEKGAAFSEAKKLDPSVLLNSRLAPDMYPLAKQVQLVSETIKNAMANLVGVEAPSWEDNEKTFPELIARLHKTLDYVKSFKPEQINGTEDKSIEMKISATFKLNFTGLSLVQLMVTPNLFFHLSTAYNILRHNGVELGKGDLLGKIQ